MTTSSDEIAAATPPADEQDPAVAAFLGSLVADAIAMPGHWYYDTAALDRDYPDLGSLAAAAPYLAPRNPHPGSILWRSQWTPASSKFDILREQAAYWGQRGIHYHQFLAAGENTLNHRLAAELFHMVRRDRGYDSGKWLDRYVALMLEPGWHRDTYVRNTTGISSPTWRLAASLSTAASVTSTLAVS